MGLILYAYVGYPLILLAIGVFRRRTVEQRDITPRVSLIIAAHNEEAKIRGKLDNALDLDYPGGRLEIIVASDCSTDGTDDIVRSYGPKGVRLVRAATRRGKEAAQKLALQSASGEVLVFSDVGTILPADAVRKIVRSFADPSVGCVSSVDRVIDATGQVSGEGAYVRYEMWLRDLEMRVNSLVGLSGSFFATRREVCRDWAEDLQSDFNTVLNAVSLGFRGVVDRECVGYYRDLGDRPAEFRRKTRTVVRGISVVMRRPALLNPLRYGLFAWQLASHKLCRWWVPFGMVGSLVASGLLAGESALYAVLFAGQCGLGLAALAGSSERVTFPGGRLLRLPSFFVVVNLSILVAWYRYARGERMVSWTPSSR